MKYAKTILIDDQALEDLRAGRRRLQCGQWVRLTWCDTPSRWVGVSPGGCTAWAVHTHRNKRGALVMSGGRSRFSAMCASFKSARLAARGEQ